MNWEHLRITLKRLQGDWLNGPVTWMIPQEGWHPIGLEALGFVFHPELGKAGLWVYTFDRTPPDPNG
jgi:hypothetical protein